MTIIELNISSENFSLKELYISENNKVLVINYFQLYYFLSSFFNLAKSKIYIGNNKLDSKSAYIINLLDYESIVNQLVLKKGSLLYDYLIDEINEKLEDSNTKEELDTILIKIINEALKDKTLDYNIEFDIDLEKTISNYAKINIDLSIENYISIIKQLIINMKKRNLKKQIIIFLNTNIFCDKLDDLNDVFLFKFYSNDFPNILINDEIENIDRAYLINQLKLNWPCDIKTNIINDIINKFFLNISIKLDVEVEDYILYVGYKLISKILSLNKIKCKYVGNYENIPQLYKNFINLIEKTN